MTFREWQYLEADRLPWPVPWRVLFQRPAPLLVEIGFGNGQFLLDWAGRRPEANVVGLEISQPSLRKTQRKLTGAHIDNVLLVHGRADHALRTLFGHGAISAVAINFPDPWPKAAHERRRLLNASFLSLLASRMHAGADLDIATDDEAYAGQVAELLSSCSQFESRLSVPYTNEDHNRIRTKYELRALQEGRRCTYFKWRRTDVATATEHPIPREQPMPHVLLQSNESDDALLSRVAGSFQPRAYTEVWGAIRFVALYSARDEPLVLVDAYVEEPYMTQRLALAIRSRADGSLVLSVHEIGFPRATTGVHRAIQRLAGELIDLYPQLSIAASNLAV